MTGTDLTDAGLAVLAELRTLQYLQVSAPLEAQETLQARLPKCELGTIPRWVTGLPHSWESQRDEILREKD